MNLPDARPPKGLTYKHTPTVEDILETWFGYHRPTSEAEVECFRDIREAGKVFAAMVLKHTPSNHERQVAMERIREATMWANASLAAGFNSGGRR